MDIGMTCLLLPFACAIALFMLVGATYVLALLNDYNWRNEE